MSLSLLMSQGLMISTSYIEKMGRAASHMYKTYQIKKRTGGWRTIDHPSRELKALQRWLVHNVLSPLPVHKRAVGYKQGVGIADNARAHVKNHFLLRMDIKDFFPSLTMYDLRSYIQRNPSLFPGWDHVDVSLFCGLVCKNGRLTIGAPTSPILSNILCYDLDAQLDGLASELDVCYTRYADDLFFSTNIPNTLAIVESRATDLIANCSCPAGLQINPGKTRHSSLKGRRRVTGVVLGTDRKISLGHAIKRRIRSEVYRLNSLDKEQRIKLAGWLAHCRSIEPDFVNRLILKFGVEKVKAAMHPSS
jgi:RNA-directed DNA polymerase